MAIMKKSNKEDAVSPVIGVMLMLVVTIVIAAVVAAFSSGMFTDMETSPNVVLKGTVDATDDGDYVLIQSLSGEALESQKVQVIVYNKGGESETFESLGEDVVRLLPGETAWLELDTLSVEEGESAQINVRYGEYVLYSVEVTVE